MSQPDALALAKQGNPRAIAAILNHWLRSLGITAKATNQNDCLYLLFEAPIAPKQESVVAFVRTVMKQLEIKSIRTVKIYGRPVDGRHTVWQQGIELLGDDEVSSLSIRDEAQAIPPTETEDLSLPDLAVPVEITASIAELDLTVSFPEPKAEYHDLVEPSATLETEALETEILEAEALETEILETAILEVNEIAAIEGLGEDLLQSMEEPAADLIAATEVLYTEVPDLLEPPEVQVEDIPNPTQGFGAEVPDSIVVTGGLEKEAIAFMEALEKDMTESTEELPGDTPELNAEPDQAALNQTELSPETPDLLEPLGSLEENLLESLPELEIETPDGIETLAVLDQAEFSANAPETSTFPSAVLPEEAPPKAPAPMSPTDSPKNVLPTATTSELLEKPEAIIIITFAILVLLWQAYLSILEDVGPPVQSLSGRRLARRLGVDSSTVSRRKEREDFSQWTQSLDPEGAAWIYGEDGKFVRVL